eukprot:TRINITY_DN17678_c0_g1_i2.p1 TRINITY_DN17678_c0_g1~~TRINITY_DN17678_c0_g1_i2.p1  ORF type:complete len:183 (+),score=26.70 TRINITY_DN17678_c0_g1_i2:56-550(+)
MKIDAGDSEQPCTSISTTQAPNLPPTTALSAVTSTSSNVSSVDPSPASSDVESSDVRMSWDEESDQDGSLQASLPVAHGTVSSADDTSTAANSNTSPSKRSNSGRRRANVRKTYLKAGLFSCDYKTLANQGAEIETGQKLKGMVYKPEEHPFSLLPPPYYCGRN